MFTIVSRLYSKQEQLRVVLWGRQQGSRTSCKQSRSADLDVCFVATLDALDEVYAHAGCKVRVLPICFTASAPPRVPEDVDVGTEAVQTPALTHASHTCCITTCVHTHGRVLTVMGPLPSIL